MQFDNSRILIFAKAPVPGQVKTRLIAELGAAGAADLHAELLEDTVKRCSRAQLAPVLLYCAPNTLHPVFIALSERYRIPLLPQVEGDLGQRMGSAVQQVLSDAAHVLLVGTDAPPLQPVEMRQALQAMEQSDAVMIPAEDGGYVLLGLKRYVADLFDDMPWGTSRVADITRSRAVAAGLDLCELPALWDVDRVEDLVRYAAWQAGQHLPML